MSIFPQITQFPSPIVNYQLSNAIVAQTYENVGLLPYQYYVTNVGYLGQLNYTAALLQNKAKAQLVNQKYKKSSIPKQYVFTTDIRKLKDFMKIRLYSPSVDRNPIPGLAGKAGREISKGFTSALEWLPGGIGDGVTKLQSEMDKGLKEREDKKTDATSSTPKPNGPTIDTKKALDSTIGKMGATANSKDPDPERGSLDAYYRYLDTGTIEGKQSLRPAFYNRYIPLSPKQKEEDITNQDRYAYREIVLPMPIEQIMDSHSHEVNSTPLNPSFMVVELLADAWTHWVGNKYFKDKSSKAIQGNTGNLVNYISNLTMAATRKTFNPNVEVLYQTPAPREFQFTINFVPTNKEDADRFLLMCEMLKEHSYPISWAGDNFYDFPGTCDFEFWVNNDKAVQLPYNKKPCFITNVMVSYINGTGTYTHYWDGNPTSIVLTITFLETELLSRADFIPREDYEDLKAFIDATKKPSTVGSNDTKIDPSKPNYNVPPLMDPGSANPFTRPQPKF